MNARQLTLLIAMSAFVAVPACTTTDSGTSPEDTPRVTRVAVTPPSTTITTPNGSATFSARVEDQNGNVMTASTQWSSSNQAVATISGGGVATAVAEGTTTITATASGVSGSAQLIVDFPNQRPAVSIQSPTNGTDHVAGNPITFAGTGSDPEDGSLAGPELVWASNVLGQLGTGDRFQRTDLPVGPHVISLTGTDSEGASETTSVTINVVEPPNVSPTVSIQSPINGLSYVEGNPIAFAGSGDDPEDGSLSGAALVWTSNITGQLGTGDRFQRSDLPVGVHIVTLTGTDTDGASESVSVTIIVVEPVNQPPTVAIQSPAEGDTYTAGSPVSFQGQGGDAEDGNLPAGSLVWSSNISGQIGIGSQFQRPDLPVGSHVITLTGTDSDGDAGTASVTIEIVSAANQLPVVSIQAPEDGDTFVEGDVIQFTGSGNDAEDGVLQGASLVWYSSIHGQLGTGSSGQTDLGVGTHVITLVGTDSQGASSSSAVTISVVNAGIVIGNNAEFFDYIDGFSYIRADDGTYLGEITSNPFAANSIMNEFGQYGSQFSSTSIFNPFSQYGSQFSFLSAYNQFTFTPPWIYVRFVDGDQAVARVTKNTFVLFAIDPDVLKGYYDAKWGSASVAPESEPRIQRKPSHEPRLQWRPIP